MLSLGIDIGSNSIKSVLLRDGRVIGKDLVATGGNNQKGTEKTCSNVAEAAGIRLSDVDKVVTTGYGRYNIPSADEAVSEIICHAKGMHFVCPEVRMILDIGGQDSKAMLLNEGGNVIDFVMNDKCAAGCGKFLEMMARSLELKLDEMGSMSLTSTKERKISSMCTVFAETEVVSLIAEGTPVEDIVKGIHVSIVTRAISLLKSLGIQEPIGMSGGVAKNIGVTEVLREKLGTKIIIPENPQHLGALGAALIAQQ